MIGVLSKADQRAAVREFFELFKTPWEYYAPGRSYDVVVVTHKDIPEVDTRLLVVYGAEKNEADERMGLSPRLEHGGGAVVYRGTSVPIYGDLAVFKEESGFEACFGATSELAVIHKVSHMGRTVVRAGYDLFEEVRFLLFTGQPIKYAHIPTLEFHIGMLRNWILCAGISLLEIGPTPPGYSFVVCLTHDIDFIGIRNHKFDHTMWGFLYRSTVGAVRNFLRRRISLSQLFKTWAAVVRLPFIYVGWAKDFWSPFEWYLQVERDSPATYFLIPFKARKGEHVPGKHVSRRAVGYDVGDIENWVATLEKKGCELGVHGLDAWHSAEKGRAELGRIKEITRESAIGIRIHWLLQDTKTASTLDEAGYAYDSTGGYNETIGYRNGSTHVFRPFGAKTLLELPLHIQDGALFYHNRLDLSEHEADKRCRRLIENAIEFGGVLTLLWHDRSHGPERFWGDFYINLLKKLKCSGPWFATAGQAVSWFRKRREVRFERGQTASGLRVCQRGNVEEGLPPLSVRVYRPSLREGANLSLDSCNFTEIVWHGETIVEFDSSVQRVSEMPVGISSLGSFS